VCFSRGQEAFVKKNWLFRATSLRFSKFCWCPEIKFLKNPQLRFKYHTPYSFSPASSIWVIYRDFSRAPCHYPFKCRYCPDAKSITCKIFHVTFLRSNTTGNPSFKKPPADWCVSGILFTFYLQMIVLGNVLFFSKIAILFELLQKLQTTSGQINYCDQYYLENLFS